MLHAAALTSVTEPLPHSWAGGISLHTRILMPASFITWVEDLQLFGKKKTQKNQPIAPTLSVIICDLEKEGNVIFEKEVCCRMC